MVGADISADGLEITRQSAQQAGTADRLTALTMDIGDEASVIAGVAYRSRDAGRPRLRWSTPRACCARCTPTR